MVCKSKILAEKLQKGYFCKHFRLVLLEEERLRIAAGNLASTMVPQGAVPPTFFEKVTIDGLGGGRAVTRRDDHLTVGRRNATCRIQSWHTRPLLVVNDYLAVAVEFRAQLPREIIMADIATCGEKTICRQSLAVRQSNAADAALPMFHMHDLLDVNRHLVLP